MVKKILSTILAAGGIFLMSSCSSLMEKLPYQNKLSRFNNYRIKAEKIIPLEKNKKLFSENGISVFCPFEKWYMNKKLGNVVELYTHEDSKIPAYIGFDVNRDGKINNEDISKKHGEMLWVNPILKKRYKH